MSILAASQHSWGLPLGLSSTRLFSISPPSAKFTGETLIEQACIPAGEVFALCLPWEKWGHAQNS